MRRGTFVPFHKLQRPVQRANHNLWLARSSKDKTLIPERDIPIDSETVDTINSNLELFNRDQFDINSTILASRSNSDLVGKRVPTPPPSDSDSNQSLHVLLIQTRERIILSVLLIKNLILN